MTSLQNLGALLRQRKHQRWVLIALLSMLHLALLAGEQTAFGLLFWVADVGLFILWQPYVHVERKLDAGGLTILLLVLAGGAWLFGWWLLIFWVTALAALVGGRVMFVDHRPTRVFYLTAFAYLLVALLVWLVPKVIAHSDFNARLIGPLPDQVFAWGMPLFLILMMFLPIRHESDRPSGGIVDFFYSLFIFLLIAVLVLGSLAFMLLSQSSYIEAVLKTLFSIALMLLLIAWAWNPRPGFSGVGVFFSRYLLTIGLPFERWLHRLTAYSASESDPERFLIKALKEVLELPWIEGGAWRVGERQGVFGGGGAGFRQDFPNEPLQLTLYTRHKMSPALVWHFHLLAQLTNEYYVAKRRGRELQQMSYLRAVHETGARLTHDIKNLLQSLNNLCYLAQGSEQDSTQLRQLLQRRLPQITQRLQQTLGKLQKPGDASDDVMPVGAWWEKLQQRYMGDALLFESLPPFDSTVSLPAALFDSVADNLLQNALAKRQSEPDLQVHVVLSADASSLRVCDSGSPVADGILPDLLQAPVASENGLGIGLYHAAQQAEGHAYELRLASNEAGNVCFELRRRDEHRVS
jgi:hypothetical protein